MLCKRSWIYPVVATMRQALFLILLFLVSIASPLAAAATTETQFKDGTTSYAHTFSQKGEGAAGLVTIPYGAEVTSATFNLRGDASQTSYTNFTTDTHYGGAGDSRVQASGGASPSPFTTAYRDNLEVSSQTMYLKGNPTLADAGFASTNAVASLGSATQNTTGEFVALSDQGYTSPTKRFADLSMTGGSWTYTGVTVPALDGELHVMYYSSSSGSLTQVPVIQRFNATTGAYIGTASFSTSSCGGSSATYYMYDADVYNGKVYTAHYSYYEVNRWNVSITNAATNPPTVM